MCSNFCDLPRKPQLNKVNYDVDQFNNFLDVMTMTSFMDSPNCNFVSLKFHHPPPRHQNCNNTDYQGRASL